MNIKRLLIPSILSLIVFSNTVSISASADITSDINGDGKVSAMDIILLKKNIFNIIPQTAFKFDINNDGFVNVIDLNILKNSAVYNTTEPPTTTQVTTTTTEITFTTTATEVTTPPTVTEPPQTETTVTFTQQTNSDGYILCANGNYCDPSVVIYDNNGNAYPDVMYDLSPGGFAYYTGNNYDLWPQNYADAAEAYYGIPMTVQGRYVMPTAVAEYTDPDESSGLIVLDEWGDLDYDATTERAEAWRNGRSIEEIPLQELLDNLFYAQECGLNYPSYLTSLGLYIQL